ncbi:ABC transporter ATP-binding protein [Metasolibacillus fluoroglycofenilyticus]|uniref:ABC transporter ATP-binding protein n=1 Tax=Metasolibacillus fluoroglycofenilyticus TaxID=1239396 RepID=UPI000D3BBE1D|nr:ABC transporter ATP-binding protein [Metasolibacillus fluoroglycofenilyticus]
MAILTVNHIHHTYFSKEVATEALHNVHFSVAPGEFVSILGASGCGKSTLLSIIAGLLEPTAGDVTFAVDDQNTSIGYMLQQDYLFPWKTIEENVVLGLKLLKCDEMQAKNMAHQLLQAVGLPNIEKKFPRQLSGGMRQRVALARTLAVDPKILLLDEPFSALDYKSKLKLEDLVCAMLKSYEKTAILVTHDIGEAIAMSDRIILMSAKPGTIHKIFDVPLELAALTPFEARTHSSYGGFFQSIWKELESLEHSTSP